MRYEVNYRTDRPSGDGVPVQATSAHAHENLLLGRVRARRNDFDRNKGRARTAPTRPSAVRGESAVGAADDEPESAFTLFESPPRELFSIVADV